MPLPSRPTKPGVAESKQPAESNSPVTKWMKVYGLELLGQVKGRSLAVKWGYMAARIHYWHINHCKPLDDDDELLRGICELTQIDDAHWQKAKAVIFNENGDLFTKDKDGRWIYSPVLPEWENATKSYAGQVLGGKKRAEQKYGRAYS